MRWPSNRMIVISVWTAAVRCRCSVTAAGEPPGASSRTRASTSSEVGPIPHSTPPSDSDTRSFPRVTRARAHPPCSGPMRWSTGTRTPVRNVSLKWSPPVISTMGRTSMPGLRMSTTKYEMPR